MSGLVSARTISWTHSRKVFCFVKYVPFSLFEYEYHTIVQQTAHQYDFSSI